MNKGAIYVICAACLVASVAFVEGVSPLCEACEKKKQLHIEVNQPTGIVQQIRSSVFAGVSATGSISPSPGPESSESEV